MHSACPNVSQAQKDEKLSNRADHDPAIEPENVQNWSSEQITPTVLHKHLEENYSNLQFKTTASSLQIC